MTPSLARTLNVLGLLALSAVLVAALVDQLVLGELPCPLCILQRVGFTAAGVGLVLNLKFGPRPSHYAMVILSAIAGGIVSARQVELHVVPGSGSYGAAILGLHFYTWVLVLAVVIVTASAVMLMFDRQFRGDAPPPSGRASTAVVAAFVLAAGLALVNAVSTGLECGGGLCPDNPTSYELIPGTGG